MLPGPGLPNPDSPNPRRSTRWTRGRGGSSSDQTKTVEAGDPLGPDDRGFQFWYMFYRPYSLG